MRLNCRTKNGKAHPYGIAVSAIDDGGKTWSPLKEIYCAEPKGRPDAPAHGCGCWEPFVLTLAGDAAP